MIIHKDEPGVIGSITGEIAAQNLNIADMINKSRNLIAVTIIDLDEKPSEKVIQNIKQKNSILSLRMCK